MDVKNASSALGEPPAYCETEIRLGDLVPVDDNHVLVSIKNNATFCNGNYFRIGSVVILKRKYCGELAGIYVGTATDPLKGELSLLKLMSTDEYRQWERELAAYNRKFLAIREEIRLRLSQQADNFTDFTD